MIIDNNKQSTCHTVKKLKLRIKNEKLLKSRLNNYIYFKKKQKRHIIITDKQLSTTNVIFVQY